MSCCWIFLVVSIFLNQASKAVTHEVNCRTEFSEWPDENRNQTSIYCYHFKGNAPLGEFIRNLRFVSIYHKITSQHFYLDGNFTFDEIASSIKIIRFYAIEGNVTISENSFKDFGNLEHLTLEAANTSSRTPKYFLQIPSQEFKNTPNLESLSILRFALTDDSVKALTPLRNQLQSVTLESSSPQKRLLQEVGQFTNLSYIIGFNGMCGDEPFPESTFRKSASTLKSITITKCHLPKISRNLFSGMTNLWDLHWQMSNITSIEQGAFDQLPNLEILDLSHNRMKNLPNGLFNQTRKLKRVELYGQVIENLTRGNFTHCPDFYQLLEGRTEDEYNATPKNT